MFHLTYLVKPGIRHGQMMVILMMVILLSLQLMFINSEMTAIWPYLEHGLTKVKLYFQKSAMTMICLWSWRNVLELKRLWPFHFKIMPHNSIISWSFQSDLWPWYSPKVAMFQLTYLVKPCFNNGHSISRTGLEPGLWSWLIHGYALVLPWFVQEFFRRVRQLLLYSFA